MLVGLVAVVIAGILVGDRGGDSLTAFDSPPADAPRQDAVLVDGAWPEVAAFVRARAGEGRPTVVKFFASWCEPCRAETPIVLDVVTQRGDDVAWLGIAHEDRPVPAAAFVQEFGLERIPTVSDELGETARVVGVLGMPGVAFFDRDGSLAGVHIGPSSARLLDTWIAGLLGDGPLPSAGS